MRPAFRAWSKVTRRPPARRRLTLERLEDRALPSASPLDAAVPLGFDAFGAAHVSHFLSTPDEVDLYKVNLQAGDVLASDVRAQSAGSGLQSLLRVFDAQGRPLALDDQEGGDPHLRFQAAAAGTYYVGISSAPNDSDDPTIASSGTPGATTGLYNLDVHRTSASLQPDLTGSSFRLGAQTASAGESIPSRSPWTTAAAPTPAPSASRCCCRRATSSTAPRPCWRR